MQLRTISSLLLSSLLFTLLYLRFSPPYPKPSHNRRILRGHHHHPPPPPLTAGTTSIPPSLPPALPPSPTFPKYPSSSLPTPTTPTTTTTTPFTTFPFFPSLPSPPPPPAPPASVSSFPVNITSVLPTAPHSAPPSRNLLTTILLPLLSVSLIFLLLSLLLVQLHRRRHRSPSTKDARSDSIRLFPPPPPSTSNPSTEFLYLGTLVSPNGTSQPLDPTTSTADAGGGGGAASGGPASPELRPLPPLPRQLGCSHGMVDNFDGSAPSSVSDPDMASTSVSSSLPTSSSPTRFSRSSKESETWCGAGRDAELRPPPIPPPPVMLLRRANLNQNSNPNPYMQRNEGSRLKPLFWDKVRPSSSSRVMAWDHLKSGSFQLNEEMIQSLFGCKTAANGAGKLFNAKMGVCSTDEEHVLIMEQKKSQNIAILLKALNVSKEQVCEALLEGNVANIGNEVLEALMKMSPTKDEESKLKEHRDDSPFKLGPAEAFIKAVIEIPFAFKRVDAMLFIADFEHEVSYLKGAFKILEGACNELRNCRLFHKLLDAVLKTGNRINSGTHRGDAKAFKLDTLLKLADIKSNDGKTTLLHFIILEVIKSENLAPQFITSLESELASVKKASTIDPNELTRTVSKLSNGIEKVRNVIQLNRPFVENGRVGLSFHERMNVFLQRAEEEMLEIQDRENVALSSVIDMAEFFHGDSVKEENEPFRILGVVRDFLTLLDSKICKEAGKMNDCGVGNYTCQMPVNADKIPSLI